MPKGKEKGNRRLEAARLAPVCSEWMDRWTWQSGQDRSTMVRAAMWLLIRTAGRMPFDQRVKFIASMARGDELENPHVEWLNAAINESPHNELALPEIEKIERQMADDEV